MNRDRAPETALPSPASRSSDGTSDRAERAGMSRRSFVKASVAGAGVVALPTVACSRPAPAPGSAVIDPETVEENWTEPPVWDPRVWGTTPLQLKVEEHPVNAVFADVAGNTETKLFSYGCCIPGPTVRMGGDDTLYVDLINDLSPNLVDFCVPETTYGEHQEHTTNLHTHGLHVNPGANPDGTQSDNVLLRIIPNGDLVLRREADQCYPLDELTRVGPVRYNFKLGTSSRDISPSVETHPPGTHWYHAHPHGATFTQVSSGMAGFLIVEGSVDAQLALFLFIQPVRHWPRRSNEVNVERLILIQRLGPTEVKDLETPERPPPSQFVKDGRIKPKSVAKIPAVNGRRVGAEGNVIVMRPGAIERWRVLNGSVDGQGYIRFMLVEGTPPPVTPLPINPTDRQKDRHEREQRAQDAFLEAPNRADLWHLAMDGITLVNEQGDYHIRRLADDPHDPNALVMAPANRADFLFQAPPLNGASSRVYTMVAQWYDLASEGTPPEPQNLTVATVLVRGEPATPPRVPIDQVVLGPAPSYLQPVQDSDLGLSPGEVRAGKGSPGQWRTRQVRYSGWGDFSFPCPQCHPRPNDPKGVPRECKSMMIDGRKFDPSEPVHKMLVGSAEEWTVWNYSMTLYEDVSGGSRTRRLSPKRAADHPFHIHVNPCWVTAIYDATGQQVDWDYATPVSPGGFQPRWQDVIRLPRNGGRVVFRSRFANYAGKYVNHCHFLQHEDWGMMQTIEVVPRVEEVNYVAQDRGYSWPKLTKEQMYALNYNGTLPGQPDPPSDQIVACLDHPSCEPPPAMIWDYDPSQKGFTVITRQDTPQDTAACYRTPG